MSNIKIKIKNGTIRAYGDPYDHDHIMLAASKLRLSEVEPTRRVKFKRARKRLCKNVRKFFRCLAYALFCKEVSNSGYIKVRKL